MMLPVLFGAVGLGVAAALAEQEGGQYGAVNLWMGGRGPGAGGGVAGEMGGRVAGSPYEYSSPSSLVANWTTGTIYGADIEGPDEDVYGFMLFGIPFGRESRLEHLTSKMEKAESKIKEYEKLAMAAGDDAEVARLATKIAKLETKKEKWGDKKEKIEDRMGAIYEEFAGRDPDLVAAQTLDTVEMLSNKVLRSARKLRRNSSGRKGYQNLIVMVASFDELVTLVDTVLRPAMQQYALGTVASVGPTAPAASVPGAVVFGGSRRRKKLREAGAPRELSPEVQEAVERSRVAARAYAQTRQEQPEAVQSVEETLHEAGYRAGQKAPGKVVDLLESVKLFRY